MDRSVYSAPMVQTMAQGWRPQRGPSVGRLLLSRQTPGLGGRDAKKGLEDKIYRQFRMSTEKRLTTDFLLMASKRTELLHGTDIEDAYGLVSRSTSNQVAIW